MKFTKSVRSIYIRNEDDSPVKIQIPKLKGSLNEYGKLELDITEVFTHIWNPIDEECRKYAEFPWNDNPRDGKFRVKVDENTHIFNSNSELVNDINIHDKFISCIIELQSVYNFKQQSGITCRVHQMKVYDPVYLFN